MNTNSSPQTKRKKSKQSARKPFRPTYDWSVEEANVLYTKQKRAFEVDKIIFDDCVRGMSFLPSSSIEMVIADPPFGLNFSGKELIYNRDKNHVVEGYKEVEINNYSKFTEKWIKELPRILTDEGGAWIFSGWTNLKDILFALEKHNLKLVNHIIWKYQFGVFTKKKFVTSHYHILFAVKNKKKYFFNKIEHYPEDVWDIKRTYHRGMKKNATKLPVDVVLRCIDFGSKPGDIILDPFMGNGTTAVACKGSFRHFLGFEINKNLEEIIKWNLKQVSVGEYYNPYSQRKNGI